LYEREMQLKINKGDNATYLGEVKREIKIL